MYSHGDMNLFRDLYDSLLQSNQWEKADQYFILADFKSYAAAQERVEARYRDEKAWARSAMLNTAKSGKFSEISAAWSPAAAGEWLEVWYDKAAGKFREVARG